MHPIRFMLPVLLILGANSSAMAQDRPKLDQAPRAAARVVSTPVQSARWHGVGDMISRFDLCVSSTTGHFSLSLSPQILANADNSMGRVEVVFTTAAGDRKTVSWNGRGDLNFNGRVAASPCSAGGNAALEIRLRQQGLLNLVAGEYANRLQFSVDPA